MSQKAVQQIITLAQGIQATRRFDRAKYFSEAIESIAKEEQEKYQKPTRRKAGR